MGPSKEFYDAVYRRDAERIKSLVRKLGVTGGDDGVFAFRTGVKRGYREVVRAFLDAGVNPNVRDDDAATPLIWAVQAGNVEIVRELLECDAEVNASDCFGWSSLFYAAVAQRLDIVQILLNSGADSNLRDLQGRTAAYWARYRRFQWRIPFLGPASGMCRTLRSTSVRKLLIARASRT